MMLENYPAKYSDKFGEVQTIIRNDGKELTMIVRGFEFKGNMLDDWEPTDKGNPELSNLFSIHPFFNQLYQFQLEFDIPVPVMKHDEILQGFLRVQLGMVGVETVFVGGREELTLELHVDEQKFISCGKHGWFEDEFQEIKNAMPENMYIKSCFNCAFSDYSPAGFGLFGNLACFRNTKNEYLSLKGKAAYFQLQDQNEYLSLKGKAAYFQLQDQMAGFVQEIYLCPEFEKRIPGTGYRG